jgi:transcriptional regulator with XRE-family HTH domain
MAARPVSKPKPQHSATYRQLARLLHTLRTDAGLTQRDVAARVCLPASTIHKIEHGDRRIDPVEFIRWCRACGVNPGHALNRINP